MPAPAAERSKLLEKAAAALAHGELDAALKQYTKIFDDDPRDWNVGNTLGDLYIRMGRTDDAASHFTMLAEQLAADGFTARARALYRKLLRLQPNDEAARLRVDELDRLQVGTASPFLKRVLETARTNREAAAPPSAAPPSAAPPSAAPPSAATPPAQAGPVAPSFAQAESGANDALARGDHREAMAQLGRFLAVDPYHVAAFEKLVDICVDGGLEAELIAAQQRLAEACVRDKRYRQAFDVSLDLCAREPGVAAHREQAERIAAIAREGGLDLVVPRVAFDVEPAIAFDEMPATVMASEPVVSHTAAEPAAAPRVVAPPVPPPMAAAPRAAAPPPAPSPVMAPETPNAPPAPPAPAPVVAAPLPIVEEPAAVAQSSASVSIGPPFGDLLKSWSDPARSLEEIQQSLLDDAAAQSEERFAQAARLIAARQLREAIAPLEDAMCVPHLRASAGSRLARVYRDTGEAVDALELLEWVAEMPPENEDSGHELAYELALTLEALGQESQALGVYRELLAEVGPSYRDIATRAQRLTAA